jgi:arsenate reductase
VPPLGRACAGELIGTYLLVFFGCGSVMSAVITSAQVGLWQVAVVWGFGISLAIYATASVSGAHLNPAVTLSIALRRRTFPHARILPYWTAQVGGDSFEVFSAGTEATVVRPLAIRAMAEVGIDISGQQSKTLDCFLREPFDVVITVCDLANETCPVFFGARRRLHWSFPDPSQASGTEDEQLAVYRQVRDAICARIEQELLR